MEMQSLQRNMRNKCNPLMTLLFIDRTVIGQNSILLWHTFHSVKTAMQKTASFRHLQ